MKIGHTGDILWQMSPLLVILFLPAIAFGFWKALLVTIIALFLHDLAHTTFGLLVKVKTYRVEFMPFGALSMMQDCSPWKMALIALAGPLANLFIVIVCLPMVTESSPYLFCLFLQANLAIALFNLLPAFPLDGGKVLVALLCPLLGQEIAEKICSFFGLILGLLIAGAGVISVQYTGQVNLALIGIGVFLCWAALRRGKPGTYAALMQADAKVHTLKKRPLHDHRIVMRKETPIAQAVRSFRKNQYNSVTIVDQNMRMLGVYGEKEVLNMLVNDGPECTLERLLH